MHTLKNDKAFRGMSEESVNRKFINGRKKLIGHVETTIMW